MSSFADPSGMDRGDIDTQLDGVLDSCLRQFGKPDYQLLQRACILSSLSLRVYAEVTSTQQTGHRVELTRMPEHQHADAPDQSLRGVPEASLLSGPITGLPIFTIWRVTDLGVVVVYRGTDSLQDIVIDINIAATKLLDCNILLHGGIYSAAAKTAYHIQATYAEAVEAEDLSEALPLFLTGCCPFSAVVAWIHCCSCAWLWQEKQLGDNKRILAHVR